MNQSDRVETLIDDLMKLYPELGRIQEGLRSTTDEAQNPPPEGKSDGSINEVRWTQLAETEKALSTLLLSLLFRETSTPTKPQHVNDFPDGFFDP